MNDRALKTLEFNKILDMLKEETASNLAKKLVEDLVPSDDIEEVEARQEETEEALKLLLNKGEPNLSGVVNIKPETKRAKMDGVLTPGGLLRVSESLRTARQIKNYGNEAVEENQNFPVIAELIECLYMNPSIENEIANAIIGENELSDNASPKLRSIRKKIIKQNEDIRTKINSIINSAQNKKHLQDNIVTIREDRFCVPVKSESKGAIPGIVHDMSSSGQTLFIEPSQIVNMNNELRELEVEERAEIERILAELSAMVAERADEIEGNQDLLVKLDFIFAKGKLAIKMNGTRPKLNFKGYINLKKARHPLLTGNVVPTDIYIGDEFTTLVITGPNTGGKTVTLKTVGLLSIMSMAGLHIPAMESSEMAVFNEVFADIGDEQSIEQSLSTFSSHLVNIVSIMKNLRANSLVLFDELGAGTDPTEGAALAMAILDYLLKIKVRTIATTHYSQLKLYALTTEGVKNASVEFDVETLSPTYRLSIGAPGKSNAFEISKRLGLSDHIIENAKKLIDSENIEFEDVLSALERDRKLAEENRQEAERTQREVDSLKAELDKKKDRIDEIREKALQEAKEEARDIVKEAKKETDELLNFIRENANYIDKEKLRELEEKRLGLNENLNNRNQSLAINLNPTINKEPPKDLMKGETVKVISYGLEGSVISLPDEEGNLIVKVGIMKVNTNISNLERVSPTEEKKGKSTGINISKSKLISPKLDLRGMNVDEAILEIDKYLDDALISGLKRVEIIHGKGTGALRKGVREHLESKKIVKNVEFGSLQEGGDGVSIVEI